MTTDGPGASSPGAPGWAARIQQLRDMEPSPRRTALFRVADAIRGVLHAMVQTSAPIEVIEAVADDVEQAAERFGGYTSKSMYEGFAEAANAGEPFGFFDHSPMLGQANPLAPPIRLWLDGDRIRGTATFGAAYEGPPGCVHGGLVAAAFDELLGLVQMLGGNPGMTGRLTIHYRSPTPLNTELTLRGRIHRTDGRKTICTGEIHAGDRLCAEAEALFVAVDPARFAALAEAAEQQKRARG